MKNVSGYVVSESYGLSKDRIRFRAPHQVQEAGIRKAGTSIGYNRGYDHAIAANYQNIGHSLWNEPPLGYCEQMLLALVLGTREQSLSVEAVRSAQDGPGYVNAVIVGELAGQLVGRVVSARESPCQEDPSRCFNVAGEAPADLAERPYLILCLRAGDQ